MFFFLFPRKIRYHIVIRMRRVIYPNKALLVVIRKKFKTLLFSRVEKNWFKFFDLWSNFELVRSACRLTFWLLPLR